MTFGKRFTTSGGNPARRDPTFQQRTYDEGLGIYDYRNRSFDPATGRFLQRDPVLDEGNLFNPYAGMGNNPVGNVDPMGTEFVLNKKALSTDEVVKYLEAKKVKKEAVALMKRRSALRRSYSITAMTDLLTMARGLKEWDVLQDEITELMAVLDRSRTTANTEVWIKGGFEKSPTPSRPASLTISRWKTDEEEKNKTPVVKRLTKTKLATIVPRLTLRRWKSTPMLNIEVNHQRRGDAPKWREARDFFDVSVEATRQRRSEDSIITERHQLPQFTNKHLFALIRMHYEQSGQKLKLLMFFTHGRAAVEKYEASAADVKKITKWFKDQGKPINECLEPTATIIFPGCSSGKGSSGVAAMKAWGKLVPRGRVIGTNVKRYSKTSWSRGEVTGVTAGFVDSQRGRWLIYSPQAGGNPQPSTVHDVPELERFK